MAEEKINPNTKIKSIPYDKIVKIEVSGFFYARIYGALTNFLRDNQIELMPKLEELKSRDPKNPKEHDLITLISLCDAIEKAAIDQDATQEHTYKEVEENINQQMKSTEEDDPEN